MTNFAHFVSALASNILALQVPTQQSVSGVLNSGSQGHCCKSLVAVIKFSL